MLQDIAHAPEMGDGRVAKPFGFALTDPGMRLSRTRLFLKVTQVMQRGNVGLWAFVVAGVDAEIRSPKRLTE